MTEKLYYEDAYRSSFETCVTEVTQAPDGVKVRLDATAFYPEGGGQGADHGILETEEGIVLQVTDVQEEDGDIWHYLAWDDPAAPPVAREMTVRGKIDWERRFDHMQQHSGEHIVSGMLCSRFQCDNIGFHLGEDVVLIDYNARISPEQAAEIEALANQYIWEDHPFVAMWPSEEELQTLEYRSKKELEGDVRIARFPGADTCACCGLHVSGSAQVGLVKFLSAKPFHDGTRLELLCGKRAMDYLTMNQRVNKAASMLMSTSEENTADRVEKLIAENIRLKMETAQLEDRLFALWAESFRGKENALVIETDLTGQQGRALADRIADCCSGMAAVFTKSEGGYQYAVMKRGADISGFIKEMNAALNGRGGGRNGFAQGSVAGSKDDIEAFFSGKRKR